MDALTLTFEEQFLQDYLYNTDDEDLFKFARQLGEYSYSPGASERFRDYVVDALEDIHYRSVPEIDSVFWYLYLEAIRAIDWDTLCKNYLGSLRDRLDYVTPEAIGLLLSDHRGIYLPQNFAELHLEEIEEQFSKLDASVLLAGPYPEAMDWNGPKVEESEDGSCFWAFSEDFECSEDWTWSPEDHSSIYWEVWSDVLDYFEFQSGGYSYGLYQSGDLFAIRSDLAEAIFELGYFE